MQPFYWLILIDAPVALAAGTLFGTGYGIVASFSRRELRRYSNKSAELITKKLKSLQEGLGSIRDLLLDGSHSTYLDT